MTTGKTIALTRWTFVGKVMSLLLNMLSRLVIIFLPRSKCLLISWLQSPSAVILEPPKIKSATVSTVSPSISHEVMGLNLRFLQMQNLCQEFRVVVYLRMQKRIREFRSTLQKHDILEIHSMCCLHQLLLLFILEY